MKKDILSCQILWPPNEDPKLVIHCIQKKPRERKCKLKIMWMIVGYDINFNFNRSYFNVQLKVQEDDFNASDQLMPFGQSELEYFSSNLDYNKICIPPCDNNPHMVVDRIRDVKRIRMTGRHLFRQNIEREVKRLSLDNNRFLIDLVTKDVWSKLKNFQRQPFDSLATKTNLVNQNKRQDTLDRAAQINILQGGSNPLIDEFYNGTDL